MTLILLRKNVPQPPAERDVA